MVHWRAHVVDFVLIAPASVHRPHWTGVRKGRHGSREVAQLGGSPISPLTRDCGRMGLRAEMKEKERTKGRGVHLAHHIALIQLESLQRQKRCSLQFRLSEASKGKVALRRKIWKMNSRLFSSHLNVNSLFNCGATDHRIISELDNIDMTFS